MQSSAKASFFTTMGTVESRNPEIPPEWETGLLLESAELLLVRLPESGFIASLCRCWVITAVALHSKDQEKM